MSPRRLARSRFTSIRWLVESSIYRWGMTRPFFVQHLDDHFGQRYVDVVYILIWSLSTFNRMSTKKFSPSPEVRPYHHGDLRRALVQAALAIVTEEQDWGFSL